MMFLAGFVSGLFVATVAVAILYALGPIWNLDVVEDCPRCNARTVPKTILDDSLSGNEHH